jgi:dihydrofolate synthase / folylpolyglutamate synthase
MSSYAQAIEWLYSRQLFGIKFGLENMQRLADALGNPETSMRFLHVAGTNGKGSVCAMADAILRAHGLRTGLFTSPHLVDFTERMRVNGGKIPQQAVVEGLTKLKTLIAGWEPGPTFFELVCALALDWFRSESVDVVVWETGMGGRLDATNIVLPEVSVITAIGMDHQRWLGDTIGAIASEKAGIIKPCVPVISVPQDPAALAVLEATAQKLGSPFQLLADPWSGPLGLVGPHQRWNAAAALAASRIVENRLDETTAAAALSKTQWPGRFQFVPPNFVLDGAHNPPAARALAEAWHQNYPNQKARLIFGALADKAVDEVLAAIAPLCEEIFFVPVRSPRSLSPAQLKEMVPAGHCCENLRQAVDLAQCDNHPILVTGSLFLVGEALALLQGREAPVPGSQ